MLFIEVSKKLTLIGCGAPVIKRDRVKRHRLILKHLKTYKTNLNWELKLQKRFNMRSLKLYVALLSILCMQSMAAASGSSAIEKCLNVSTNVATDCIRQHLKVKTLNSCYNLSNTIYSIESKEKVKEHCFYSISEFPTLDLCLNAAKKFYLSENKDHAVFECVRQFADTISEKNCLKASKLMTYPERKRHLEGHCRNL